MSIETGGVSRHHEMIGNQTLAKGSQRSSHLDAHGFAFELPLCRASSLDEAGKLEWA
jgi:hypothetical protein